MKWKWNERKRKQKKNKGKRGMSTWKCKGLSERPAAKTASMVVWKSQTECNLPCTPPESPYKMQILTWENHWASNLNPQLIESPKINIMIVNADLLTLAPTSLTEIIILPREYWRAKSFWAPITLTLNRLRDTDLPSPTPVTLTEHYTWPLILVHYYTSH